MNIQIRVKVPSGKTLRLDVEEDDSIENVKQKIQDTEGIAPDKQRLFFSDLPLENGRTLADYGIPNDALLTMYLSGQPFQLRCDKECSNDQNSRVIFSSYSFDGVRKLRRLDD
ncbi:Ubiquitin family [Yasminevirus sp. GU-2018]|uniref:Ubiquitin family n=1 Tax=Yasminevirus sp. GU-2018 TaxID=2420051 RepID=A0A5K0U951_9VIRU|nr:Ubiquitin family [Yasminevirus sp. GU-2018]